MGIILNLLLPGAFALQEESSNKPKRTDGQTLYNPELDLKPRVGTDHDQKGDMVVFCRVL
jgi:hypothetical protein